MEIQNATFKKNLEWIHWNSNLTLICSTQFLLWSDRFQNQNSLSEIDLCLLFEGFSFGWIEFECLWHIIIAWWVIGSTGLCLWRKDLAFHFSLFLWKPWVSVLWLCKLQLLFLLFPLPLIKKRAMWKEGEWEGSDMVAICFCLVDCSDQFVQALTLTLTNFMILLFDPTLINW